MNQADAKWIVSAAVLLLTFAGMTQTTASGQSENARENRIVGAWDVQVTTRNCSTGATIFNGEALHKYELGGTGLFVPASNPALTTPRVSVWKQVGKNLYTVAVKEFRFDPLGNLVGWVVVRNDVEISEDGTSYTGSGRGETFDTNGNSLGIACPVFTGSRFE